MSPAEIEARAAHERLGAEHGGIVADADFAPGVTAAISYVFGVGKKVIDDLGPDRKSQYMDRTVLCSVVDSDEVNARAQASAAGDHVFICKGLVGAVYGVAHAAFASPAFLPGVGNAGLGGFPGGRVNVQDLRWPVTRKDQAAPGFSGPVVSGCELRRGCAIDLAISALAIVLLHEIGHVFGGHFGLATGTPGLAFEEAPSARPPRRCRSVPLGIIEWDADHFALTSLMRLVRSSPRPVCGTTSWPGLPAALRDPLVAVLAAGLVFRTLDPDGIVPASVDLDVYPAAIARALGMALAAVQQMNASPADQGNFLLEVSRHLTLLQAWFDVHHRGLPQQQAIAHFNRLPPLVEELRASYPRFTGALDQHIWVNTSWRPREK